MSWNPVLDFVKDLKSEFIKYNNDKKLYYYKNIMNKYKNDFNKDEYDYDYSSSVNYWASVLYKDNNIDYYYKVLSFLKITELNDFILMRYKSYAEINNISKEFDDLVDINLEKLWGIYNGFYRECRSVVIDFVNEKLVLTPYKKFFNYNELKETSEKVILEKINNCEIFEITNKFDGSMQSYRYYKDEIVCSGSLALDKDNSWRLEDGYNMFMSDESYYNLCKDFPSYTFVFEYISEDDAHIVKYSEKDYGLYLIGARNTFDGKECNYEDILYLANKYNIKTTVIFDKKFEDVLNELDSVKSDVAEGFVINIDGYRIKLKYNDYVSMHRIINELSSVNLIIKNIADDKYDDFISKVPKEFRNRVEVISKDIFRYINLMTEMTNKYYEHFYNKNIKTFMINVDINAPRYIRKYLKNKYNNKTINYLKSYDNKYIKLGEICDLIDKIEEDKMFNS